MVLTMAGEQLCGRMGVSLLSALDLPGWVAEDEDDYVDRACTLAADPEGLAELRANLRKRMSESPLCDAEGFTRALEANYRRMYSG